MHLTRAKKELERRTLIMHYASQQKEVERRDSTSTNNAVDSTAGLGVACALVFVFIVLYQIRLLRIRQAKPRYIPTSYLKQKWQSWTPGSSSYGRIKKSTTTTSQTSNSHALRPTSTTSTGYAPTTTLSTEIPTSTAPSNNADVDRRTSVRSIMTLPPYRPSPHDSELLIAREGERAGVDTVVEYPESENELETARETEMSALYAIREARRREAAERDERRRQRQEATERGDTVRLAQLQEESRARARARSAASLLGPQAALGGDSHSAASSTTNVDSAYLIAELASQRESRSRSRRVSSVSYADLGLARHDGSRIRADSVESDNRPLLDSAASIGSRAVSRQSSPGRSIFNPRPLHGRHASDASIMSIDSDMVTGMVGMAHTPHTRSDSDPPLLTPHSSNEDEGEVPSGAPPAYDDAVSNSSRTNLQEFEDEAPPYESPVREHHERVVFPSHDALENELLHGPTPQPPASQPQTPRAPSPQLLQYVQRQPAQPSPLRVVATQNAGGRTPTPQIEVLSATPVDSRPSTPEGGRGWR